ncbi:MAG: ABC transporter permease [Rhodospirillaceae bacterium]|nr:ABC transporter permease [Rhodospirillaceae bacterium]
MSVLGFDRRDLRLGANLFRMALRDRYLGSALGMAWAIANPLLMLGLFAFVFGYVFTARLPGAETSLTFVIWLISGYGPWLAISEGLNAAASSVVGAAGIVKNLPFKTELLPAAAVLTGLVPLAVALVLVVALLIAGGGAPAWAWLILPVVVVLQLVFIAGLGLFLAALTVFVRDVAVALPNLLLLVLFASPIFYPLSAYPAGVGEVLRFNPFYVIAEGYRTPLTRGELPPAWSILYLLAASVVAFALGLRFFRRLKSHFEARL